MQALLDAARCSMLDEQQRQQHTYPSVGGGGATGGAVASDAIPSSQARLRINRASTLRVVCPRPSCLPGWFDGCGQSVSQSMGRWRNREAFSFSMIQDPEPHTDGRRLSVCVCVADDDDRHNGGERGGLEPTNHWSAEDPSHSIDTGCLLHNTHPKTEAKSARGREEKQEQANNGLWWRMMGDAPGRQEGAIRLPLLPWILQLPQLNRMALHPSIHRKPARASFSHPRHPTHPPTG